MSDPMYIQWPQTLSGTQCKDDNTKQDRQSDLIIPLYLYLYSSIKQINAITLSFRIRNKFTQYTYTSQQHIFHTQKYFLFHILFSEICYNFKPQQDIIARITKLLDPGLAKPLSQLNLGFKIKIQTQVKHNRITITQPPGLIQFICQKFSLKRRSNWKKSYITVDFDFYVEYAPL